MNCLLRGEFNLVPFIDITGVWPSYTTSYITDILDLSVKSAFDLISFLLHFLYVPVLHLFALMSITHPSSALLYLTEGLTPTACVSQVRSSAGFRLGLASGRDWQKKQEEIRVFLPPLFALAASLL